MSDTSSFFSTLISSHAIKISAPKTILGLLWSWMAPTTCYGHVLSTSSSALRTSWLTYLSPHLLLQISLIRHGFWRLLCDDLASQKYKRED